MTSYFQSQIDLARPTNATGGLASSSSEIGIRFLSVGGAIVYLAVFMAVVYFYFLARKRRRK